ncbi:MAG: alpha/beta hydrolase [Oscillospiraceae bacterium]
MDAHAKERNAALDEKQLNDHITTELAKEIPDDIRESYHQLDHFTNVMLWEPVDLGERSQIVVVTMHGGYGREMRHSLMMELARRGFRSINVVPAQYDFPSQMLDFKLVINFARSIPGVKKVVLMGQSRGASIMSAYQKVAENGEEVFRGPQFRYQFPDIGPLPAADGLMLLDANFGIMQMLSVNPALVEEGCATRFNPELDAINPANGFDPKGSDYSAEFCRKFWDAQRKRYMSIMDYAEERLHLIEQGKGNYYDDEPLNIAEMRGTLNCGGKLFYMDKKFFAHTHNAWDLIHPDGSITNEIIHSVRIPKNDVKSRGIFGKSAWSLSVKILLQSEVRLDEGWGYDDEKFYGVNFESCMFSSTGNVKKIRVPLLVMGMTGSFEYVTAEWTYNNAISADKTIAFVEGASHSFRTAKETEAYPGQWGDTLATTADYVSGWLTAEGRFI